MIDERRTSPLLEGNLPMGGGDRPTGTTRAYSPRPGATWWLRNRRYVVYMLRELTAIPIAAWVILFMVEVGRLQSGRSGYEPLSGPIWVAFSAFCLLCALYHSFTFLSLAGRIIRIPKGESYVQPRIIVGAMFSLLAGATIVVAALLVLGGMGAR